MRALPIAVLGCGIDCELHRLIFQSLESGQVNPIKGGKVECRYPCMNEASLSWSKALVPEGDIPFYGIVAFVDLPA